MLQSLHSIWKNFFNLGLFQAAGMLIQLIAIPIITANHGLETFGEVALITSTGALLGNLVNFGTNQTEIKAISIHRNDHNRLADIYNEIFSLRLVICLLMIALTIIPIFSFNFLSLPLVLSLLPLIVSEIFNPLYFLIGIEKIHWISWGNLCSRAISLLLLMIIPLSTNIPAIINLMLTAPIMLFNIGLSIYLINKFNIKLYLISVKKLKDKLKNNFYVTFNGSSAILQQSIFMFFVAGTATPQILGAYGIIDKFSGAFRQLISACSSAIYPKAAQLYQKGIQKWNKFRTIVQRGYLVISLLIAFLFYFFADQWAILLYSKADPTITFFLQCFSIAPLAIALNANNVLDMLLAHLYKQMFLVSCLILLATFLISFALTHFLDVKFIGFYPIAIESTCLLLYTLVRLKSNSKNALE